MRKRPPNNLPASVRDRLLAISRKNGEDFQLVLVRFANERLLYRLSQSQHKDSFILKGANLFAVWAEFPYRPTRDMDFLGLGELSPDDVVVLFRDLCRQNVTPDGITFRNETVQSAVIGEERAFQGVRVTLKAEIASAVVPLQIDVAFGDELFEPASETTLSPMLDFPPPVIRTYPREAVISEKLQAMVELGIANSRMKDFFDLWVLSREIAFEGERLLRAIHTTFRRRGTSVPSDTPVALTPEFGRDRQKAAQWEAFVTRTGLTLAPPSLVQVIDDLRGFLLEPLAHASRQAPFSKHWNPGGPWG